MTFGKAVAKGEGQIVGEYRELTLQENFNNAVERIKRQQKTIDNLEGDAMRYRRLRQLEVIIMAEDGAKYLKGKDLDHYIDDLPMREKSFRAQMINELVPALNKLFGDEYAKYSAEHKEVFNGNDA